MEMTAWIFYYAKLFLLSAAGLVLLVISRFLIGADAGFIKYMLDKDKPKRKRVSVFVALVLLGFIVGIVVTIISGPSDLLL